MPWEMTSIKLFSLSLSFPSLYTSVEFYIHQREKKIDFFFFFSCSFSHQDRYVVYLFPKTPPAHHAHHFQLHFAMYMLIYNFFFLLTFSSLFRFFFLTLSILLTFRNIIFNLKPTRYAIFVQNFT